MADKFPVFAMVRQSARQVWEFKQGLLITVGFLIGMVVLIAALMLLVFSGTDPEFFSQLVSGQLGGDEINPPKGFLPFFFLVMAAVIVGYAWVFNMWIRYGAFGRSGAFFDRAGESIVAAIVTALKMFFILILLAIVVMVFFLIITGLGILTVSDAANLESASIVMAVTINLVAVAVISGVYSLFSSNLTQTAIGSQVEEVGPPHVLEFAIVLFILEAIFLVPLIILQSAMLVWLTVIFQLVAGVWITAAIPLAHGVRYDWQRQAFAGETAVEQFNLSERNEDEE